MEQPTFDEHFRRQLMEVVDSNRMPPDICRAFGDDNQSRVIKSKRVRSFINRINRSTMSYLCAFHRINFTGEINPTPRKATLGRKIRCILHERGRWAWELWPYAWLAAYLVVVPLLVHIIRVQYKYDINSLRLSRLNDTTKRAELASRMDVEALQSELEANVAAAWSQLDLLGATNLNLAFLSQTIIIIYLSSSLNTFILLPINHKMNGWSLSAIRLILSPKDENQSRLRLIMDEMEAFAANSLSFVNCKLIQLDADIARSFKTRKVAEGSDDDRALRAMHDKALQVSSDHLYRKHGQTIEQLKATALQGRFNPLNRTPACIDKMAATYLACLTATALALRCVDFFIVSYMLNCYGLPGKSMRLSNYKEVVCLVLLCLFYEIHARSVLFAAIIQNVVWIDQLESMSRLRLLIKRVLWANERRACRLHRLDEQRHHRKLYVLASDEAQSTFPSADHCQRSSTEWHRLMPLIREEIETDLLMVKMQCQLVEKSFVLARTPMSFLAYTATWFAVAMLSLFRLQSPYFDPELKSINLVIVLSCASCVFSYLAPFGMMHWRSIKAFQELWSLSAQLSYFESIPSVSKCLKTDSNVTVFALRRDLADARQRMDRFACHLLSFPLTRQTLIRAAFWTLLVMLSLSNDTTSLLGENFTQITNDPFGLFNFD